MRRDMRFVGFLTGIVAVGCFCPAQAASGDLDPTFGTLGKVTTAIGPADDWGCAVALQADGKIVVAGCSWNAGKYDFALVRYNTNGSLDLSFGVGGIVTTPAGPGGSMGSSMALQSDGKIVVGGMSHNSGKWDFALARYEGFTPKP